jgi:hypothetical protein
VGDNASGLPLETPFLDPLLPASFSFHHFRFPPEFHLFTRSFRRANPRLF